jgi:6-hydroxy-3-succinoylpyridine 3-monooxygenase
MQPVARTRVYVDGYNLYYGCLKGSPYKWLDPLRLVEAVLAGILIRNEVGDPIKAELLPCALKFFTANILECAAKAGDSVSSQMHYHNALCKLYPERLEIIKGYYSLTKARAHIVDAEKPDRWPRECSTIQVWKLEEKQSDVSLALHAFHDAIAGNVDQVVIMTNDTDIAPAVQMIRQHTPVKIGIIIPTRADERHANADLVEHAHWCRRRLTDEDLAQAQLPRVIQGGSKSTTKPISWYPRPDLVQQAIDMCLPILSKRNAVMKWLYEPNEKYFAGKSPIDLCTSEDGVSQIAAYIKLWNEREK